MHKRSLFAPRWGTVPGLLPRAARSGRLFLLPGAIALLLALAAPALGQTQVVSGHPRLFLRAADVAALKQRCRSLAEVKKPYQMIRQFAYGNADNPNLWVAPDELSAVLVAYLVEDRDPKLLARARRYLEQFSAAEGDSWTRPRMLKALAQAYDWLHEDLTREERSKCAARMSELVEQMRKEYRHSDYNNHVYLERGPILYAGLALAGDGIADDFARSALAEGELLLKKHFLPTVNQVGGDGQGGWHEGMSYWSFFAYELAHQLEVWRTATGEDLFPSCTGLRGAANWLLYCTRPHDGSMAPVADINTPSPWGWQENAYLPLLAARYRDGLAQQAASRVPLKYPFRAWPRVLWYDPSVKPVAPDSLPPGTLFPGVGWAAMRSSWDKDAVWALFVCGDYYAGHQHGDQNSLIIARGGDLAVDAGEYGAKATAFHNTILLGDGQRPYRTDPRRFFAPTAAGSEFDTGEILAFEENRWFTYVVGDASNAYGVFRDGRRVGGAPRFVRRFIFLKPATFVIDDLVSVPASQPPVRWLLHSRRAPEITGRSIRIIEGDGELLCETLLPEKVTLQSTRQVGGRRQRPDYCIEVLPQGSTEEIRLLHVLHARQRGDKDSVAHSEFSEKDGTLRLTVSAEQRVFRLTLPPERVGGCEIAVAQADDKELLPRRPLAAGILPYGREGIRLLERWDAAYRGGRRPGWDTGRPSSNLARAVEQGVVRPGRAVVLGCGSGTNAIYLAGKGFEVTGIDIAPTALALAKQKADRAGVKVRWLLTDVLAPPQLEPFDLIFDRGCYHGVRRQNARGYVETVRRLSRAGTQLLLLAGSANEPPPHRGPPRVKEEELRGDFSAWFEFQWLRETRFDSVDPAAKGALAWSALLRRKDKP